MRGFRQLGGICRTVSISFSQEIMRFQVGMLWDANKRLPKSFAPSHPLDVQCREKYLTPRCFCYSALSIKIDGLTKSQI
jgi:hypothetical protein